MREAMHHLVLGTLLLCEEELPFGVYPAVEKWEKKEYNAHAFEEYAMVCHHEKYLTAELACAAALWACKGVGASRCDDRAMDCIMQLLKIKKEV